MSDSKAVTVIEALTKLVEAFVPFGALAFFAWVVYLLIGIPK